MTDTEHNINQNLIFVTIEAIFFILIFKIGMNKKISFSSRINFVDYEKFAANHCIGDYIGYRHNVPNIIKTPKFYTCQIRTCTGGGLVTPGQESEGFHLWDDLTNTKNFKEILNKLFRYIKNPERALLIGSKNLEQFPYSALQYQNLKKEFLNRVKNVTLFEEHRHKSAETHFQYSLNDDVWTIYSRFWQDNKPGPKTVNNLKNLMDAFRNIQIAKGDSLYFNGKKIKPANCPEIFEK